jgi:hypothetical protein
MKMPRIVLLFVLTLASVASAAPQRWVLSPDPQPAIPPNSQILLFIHGMDSRAEESDDITKELFAQWRGASLPPQSTPGGPNPQVVAVLRQLLEKYRSCVLERYETQQDMRNRGLSPNLSGLVNTNGLQPRDAINCVAGNPCTRVSRSVGFANLQAQANRGDTTNFLSNLERTVPADCFDCAKHQEWHTKHVHCTMDVGGNSGIIKGPAFEACKAGVDIQALIDAVIRDIKGVINDLTQRFPEPPDVTGGASIATNHVTVRFTSCPNPVSGCPDPCDNPDTSVGGQRTAVVPTEIVNGQRNRIYFAPVIPPSLLDTPPPPGTQINVPAAHNIGMNEGRLRADLRGAAAAADPRASLRLAALRFASGDTVTGRAFADLAVTGRRSFAAFRTALPQEEFCRDMSRSPGGLDPNAVLNGCFAALDRAYRVANFLRTGQRGDTPALKTRKTNERNDNALGWIAVSGEDDSPHRPVNVPSSDFPQFDLDVQVEAPRAVGPKTVTVHTRYVIAQSAPINGRTLVVIAMDLPTSGYATNLDFDDVSPLADIGAPKWTPLPVPVVVPVGIEYAVPGLPPGFPPILPPGFTIPPGTPLPDFQATGRTPLLDFIETFIVRFVETLDNNGLQVKSNVRAVMGGSLGGNMTFRLGRRAGVPWLPRFIVWSPASIWNSLGEGSDLFKHFGPRKAWEDADKANRLPGTGDRAAFFGGWDKAIVPVIIPMAQSDTWTSDFYPCKKSSVAGARLDRHETYDAKFLAWHWRLGAEQLLYSHQTNDPTTNRPRFTSNVKPMLLACGTEDHVAFNNICPATQNTAPLMTITPGRALFLDKTGHSLDNERKRFFARQVLDFIRQ